MDAVPLSDDDRANLSARADEFHAALARGGVTDWEKYLAGLPERVRPAVLAELVIIDLAHRWGRGEKPTVEEYIARFPEFGPADRVPTPVVLEEHRCRMKAGEPPDPAGFQARFPGQFPAIREEVTSGRAGTVAGTVVSTITGGAAGAPGRAPGAGSEEYEFLRVIGRGVFGEVWLARKRASGIEKAVKVLMQAAEHESASRERRALELIKNLRHPYLLATDDFWVADNRLHVAMELAEGTLRDELRRCRERGRVGIPPGELLGYIWEAAEGLDFLHSRHIIHRDVKPDNILLLHAHAKVGDFGLARYRDAVLSPMRTFAGTPAYMAPEVWGRDGGPASDQYSLAVTYAELRQGAPPLRPQPIQDMLVAHTEGDFVFSEVFGDGERAIVLKALSREPEDRYPSCRAFAEALSAEFGNTGTPRSGGGFTPAGGEHLPDTADPHVEIGKGTRTAEIPPTLPPTPQDSATPTVRRPRWMVAAAWLVAAAFSIGAGTILWKAFGARGPTDRGAGDPGNGAKPDPVWAPRGTVAAPGSKVVEIADGKYVYEVVEAAVGDQKVRFRLIVGQRGPRVDPFYIMESKVWNGLYKAGGGKPDPETAECGTDCPVLRVTWAEAGDFAKSTFGGRLPTPTEWDHAAGFYLVPRPNPLTKVKGRPQVALRQPNATHGSVADPDENALGLRDMAGNGWELTSEVRKGEERDRVVVRGQNFTFQHGLSYAELDRQHQEEPHTVYRHAPSDHTSFRVVLPGPP